MSDSTVADGAKICVSIAIAYKPSPIGNRIVGAFYALTAIALLWHAITTRRPWTCVLPIGAFASAAGYFIRPKVDPCNFSTGLFIAQQLVILVSPCLFLAFNYMLYKRLMIALDPTLALATNRNVKSPYSFLPPLKVSRIFVWSDCITFILQCSAGGLMAIQSQTLQNVGNYIFLFAVIVQAISYGLFWALAFVAHRRLSGEANSSHQFHATLKTLFICLYFSSFFIMVRSIYRIAEFATGHDGYLITHETFLFILDAAPLILAIGIWAVRWPLRLIDTLGEEHSASLPMAAKLQSSSPIYA
ncbi:hypothetical protein ACQY0O_003714 [Thecaphora frezii]